MRVAARAELRLAPLDGVVAAFTGREHGNVSLVLGEGEPAAARRSLGPLVGAEPAATVFMEQVHGPGVARVGREHAGRGLASQADTMPAVDALVTEVPGLPLAVLTADCVPVLLAKRGAVAAAHAGRAGLLAGVVEAVLDALAPLGEGAVSAVVGPAIGACCYEVPEQLAADAERRLPGIAARSRWGTPSLDLPGTVARRLAGRGVRVAVVGACTRCEPAAWFSHRASGDGREPAGAGGRQASVIALADNPVHADEGRFRWPLEWLS